jgi:hypothetical protein
MPVQALLYVESVSCHTTTQAEVRIPQFIDEYRYERHFTVWISSFVETGLRMLTHQQY